MCKFTQPSDYLLPINGNGNFKLQTIIFEFISVLRFFMCHCYLATFLHFVRGINC